MSCTLRHLLFVVTTFVLCLDQFAHGGLSRSGQSQGRTNRAKFLLTAPEKPHFDTNYTVTVTAYAVFNPRRPQSVELVYRGFKDSSRILNRTLLTFFKSGVQTWTVVFPWMMMDKYEERAVTLTLSTLSSPSNEAKKTLYFSRDTGYIFIQTDKPLYTPKQTVKFRIIAVDEYQKLAQYPLKVEIRNEKEIVMDMLRYSAEDAFKGQEFQLPKETPPGNWTITANYEGINNVQSKPQKVSFEVKEYVLPRFSADLKVSKDVITKNTSWITITVSAKYVYGQYALGGVSMQLGIWDPEKGVTLLPQMYTANLTKGVYTRDVRISKLIPRDMIVRANRRLYISVNVTEDGTGEIDSIQDTSVFIAHPYYEITHTESKMRFKPGFPYTLHTSVRARSGRPASWVDLYVSTEYIDRRGRKITGGNGYQKLNDKGKFTSTYNIPANAHTIKFKTYVLDFKAGSNNDDEFTVQKLKSESDQYLHIELVKPISKYADGLINLRYTVPAWYAPPSPLTVMVLSKGHKVFSHSTVLVAAGQSVVTLPKSLHSEVSPSMRIVATYNQNVDGDGTPEFVFDSLLVDTDDVCLEELSLMKPGGHFASPLPKKPKDEYKLQVKGGPFMKVGLVAVDKAVFLLNDKHSLTRESAFKQLNSHDQGTGIGDGITMEEVMMTSGLIHLFVETGFNELWRKGETSAVSSGSGRFKETKRPYTGQSKRGPNGLNSETSGRGRSGNENGYGVFTQTPPQTVRKYFPESWLFQEDILPKSGRKSLNLTLPDSITTWSFLAVGVSANRGVCVSRVLEQRVQKKFFVDVRLPYKVTRLEEVKVKVAVYNYYTEPIEVKVKVSGVKGLCFTSNSARGSSQNFTSFTLKIGSKRTKGRDIKVLPLENGDLTLTVDASSVAERDVVERNIYVVAEGMRMKKSLTFVLDPEAKHASFQTTKRRKVMLTDTATIKNMVDLRKKTQKTEIDLAMPKEIIRGTENCKISAFGDLMGDIINHAVINSKSLMEPSVHNAEEVLGDLGPTVHALLYANMSGLMDDALLKRAEKFVKHGVARLLRYRKEQGFALTPESPEGTWLTTAVLKTLCRSSKLAFVDKQILIDHGFYWLLQQARDNGTLEENDWRLAKNSHEYQVMLSADVLIAMIECGRTQGESHSELLYSMAFFLEDNMETIQEPMVMAKVTYALMLYEKFSDSTVEEEEGGEEEGVSEGEGEGEEVFEEEEGGEEEFEEEGAEEAEEVYEEEPKVSVEAVKRLVSMSKMNDQGQVYWSNEEVTNEGKKVPFWYRKGVKASAIEATAYALLVFLDHPGANVDAIADWLVSQRNNHGSFISALDSMAAIEALSAYSLQKTGLKVDLSCNITSDKTKHYSHSFTFTELNAIKPESLNNVPVGHSLEVLTKGQGLGQMQINVEYNVPIDPNEACAFNVTLDIKQTRFSYYPDMHEDALCTWCTWWCRPIIDNTTLNANLTGNDTSSENSTASAAANDNVIVMGVPEPPRNKEEEEKEDAILELAPPLVKPRTRTRSRRPRPKATIEVSSPNMEVRRRGRQKGGARITLSVNRRRNNKRNRRTRRSAGTQGSASHKSICMKVCLQHLETGSAGHTRVDVDMLTGFIPVDTDIQMMKKHPDVLDAWFEIEFEKLSVIFKEVSDEYQTCVGFRAVDHQNVERPTPANVIVTEVGNPAPSCAKEYSSPFRRKSLQAYCANLSNQNRGECRCYSGLCSKCTPGSTSEKFRYNEAWKLVCKSKVGYQLQLTKFTGLNQWVEMEATVLSANRTGIHKVKADDTITIRSPASCMCPKHFFRRDHGNLYMISPDVEKMVDRYGNVVHRYLLDEHSSFLRVSNPNPSPTTPKYSSRRTTPTVLHHYLKQAFKNCPVA